ncbi:MAG: FAD-binding oxidoreductase [Sandaracinaceae bacterium]|nr:FAD-binding oxidoreductase [Sandaracinaceae bacterium]
MTRRLSHWGWGWEDRFPDQATRKMFAQQVRLFGGFDELELREPKPLEDATLPAPSVEVKDKWLADIATTAAHDRASRCYGRAYRDIARGFEGDFAAAPDVVLKPVDEQQVKIALEWASENDIAVVPYGGGTSVVSGVEVTERAGFRGVACLDLRGLDRVLEVDPLSSSARIQAGATGPRLEEQLRDHGLTLRFFPQSFELSTLGGWIATRAGGHFATLQTHIDDLVQSTRMVTPRGVFETRRLPGSGAGPSPDRLVLGSEGTLGVITEAWVRVRPRPIWRASANVRFANWTDCVEATREIAQSGLHPSNCRVLDKREALLNRVATDGTHVLLLGFESADHEVNASMERALDIVQAHRGQCPDGPTYKKRPDSAGRRVRRSSGGDDASERWRQAFLDAPYIVNSMVSLGVIADTFETAVTWDRFEALHRNVIADVRDAMRRVCGKGIITCRFTHVYPDGPAPYFTFVAPAKRGWALSQWAELKAAASDAILAHGGTITHHHAVGRMHRPWYEKQRPELYGDVLSAVKATLDPAGVLNPGVLVAAPRAPRAEG